jgi:hypothetical protein
MFTKTRKYFLSAAAGIAGITSLAAVSAANAQMPPMGFHPGYPGGYGYPGSNVPCMEDIRRKARRQICPR